MKLEAPLLYLFKTCEKVCQADCCGIDAFDFSPIHIASYLINDRRVPDEEMVDTFANNSPFFKNADREMA